MDEDRLKRIALRVAQDDEDPKKKDIEFEAKWPKARNIFQSQMKATFKDLEKAIKEEDSKLVQYLFEHFLDQLILLSKSFGMRDLTPKLKNVVKTVLD